MKEGLVEREDHRRSSHVGLGEGRPASVKECLVEREDHRRSSQVGLGEGRLGRA